MREFDRTFTKVQLVGLGLLALIILVGSIITFASSQDQADALWYSAAMPPILLVLGLALAISLYFLARMSAPRWGLFLVHLGLLLLILSGGVTSLHPDSWILGLSRGASSDRAFHASDWLLRLTDSKGSLTVVLDKAAPISAPGWDGYRIDEVSRLEMGGARVRLSGGGRTIILDTSATSLSFADGPRELSLEPRSIQLPFTVTLDEFAIEKYPGNEAAADYLSRLTITDQGQAKPFLIRMNQPLRYAGYTFYQQSYVNQPDGSLGSVLMLRYQPWFWAPYLATGVLALGLMYFGFEQRSKTRSLLRLSLASGHRLWWPLVVALAGLAGLSAGVGLLANGLQSSADLGLWPVTYNNRLMTFDNYASYHSSAIGYKTDHPGRAYAQALGLLDERGQALVDRSFLPKAAEHQLPGDARFSAGTTTPAWPYFAEWLVNQIPWFPLALVICLALFGLAWYRRHHQFPLRVTKWLELVCLIGLWIILSAWLAKRILLTGQPPVSNLQASLVLVAWLLTTVGLGLRIIPIGGPAGIFILILVAWLLEPAGDPYSPIPPVLRSTLWLSVHVLVIVTGYALTFAASAYAHVRLWLARKQAYLEDGSWFPVYRGLVTTALGLVAIGMLLGGFWADQSWGRFWAWDPKENGALLIVLHLAAILHSRRQALTGNRAFLLGGALLGITLTYSWFGVNFLGKGLHSYGFMTGPFAALAGLVLAETVFTLTLWLAGRRKVQTVVKGLPQSGYTPLKLGIISPFGKKIRLIGLSSPELGQGALTIVTGGGSELIERSYICFLYQGQATILVQVRPFGRGTLGILRAAADLQAAWVKADTAPSLPRPSPARTFFCEGTGITAALAELRPGTDRLFYFYDAETAGLENLLAPGTTTLRYLAIGGLSKAIQDRIRTDLGDLPVGQPVIVGSRRFQAAIEQTLLVV